MTLLELIKKYADDSGSSEPDRKYSALLFALQLPGIYGRLENPVCEENKECKEDSKESKQYKLYDKNGKAKDKVIYKYWFMRHAHDFLPWCYGATSVSTLSEWIYDLRCSLTHEGKIINSEMKVFLLILIVYWRTKIILSFPSKHFAIKCSVLRSSYHLSKQ